MSTFTRPNIHANKGRSLEKAVEFSAGNLLELVKVPNGQRYLAGGKTIPVKSPVDYMGAIRATGRAICFDAKKCALVKAFPISNRDHFPAHQREFLIRMGEAGAVSGLLVESTADERFLWLDWPVLLPDFPSIPWGDLRWLDLGPSTHLIRFQYIPGVFVVAAAGREGQQ